MRIISFKKEEHQTDPVSVGDIFRIRKGNKWHTVIAVNEEDYESCRGCLFEKYDACNVPNAEGSVDTLCCNTRCIFKSLDKALEEL